MTRQLFRGTAVTSKSYTELDVFHGKLEGLRFVEVEFPDKEASESFTPPEWFGEDVSADPSYRNSYLSTLESADEFMKKEQDHE